jgi:hypothetical protein
VVIRLKLHFDPVIRDVIPRAGDRWLLSICSTRKSDDGESGANQGK